MFNLSLVKITFCGVYMLGHFAIANDLTIVEVKRNIPLSDDEPTYKDFYILQNSAKELKKNSQVVVKRKLFVKDSSAKNIGEIETAVGVLKIISSDSKIAVGREVKIIPRENEVMLEQPFMMIGDQIDLSLSIKDYASQINKSEELKMIKTDRLPAQINPEKNTQETNKDSLNLTSASAPNPKKQ